MEFEHIVLSEGSQTEKDKYCMISLICETLKKILTTKEEIRFVVTRSVKWRMGKLDEAGPKVQTPSYETNLYRVYNVQHDAYS